MNKPGPKCETPEGAAQKVHAHERKMHAGKPLTKLKPADKPQTQTRGYGR